MDHWVSDYWPIFEKQMHDVSSLSVTMSQKFLYCILNAEHFAQPKCIVQPQTLKKEYEGCVITCN